MIGVELVVGGWGRREESKEKEQGKKVANGNEKERQKKDRVPWWGTTNDDLDLGFGVKKR